MKRRGFLAGILAAGVAPAIVHNPMKIWVPRQEIQRASLGIIDSMSIRRGVRDLVIDSPYGRVETVTYDFVTEPGIRRDQFGEMFFPTMVVHPLMVGLNGEALL